MALKTLGAKAAAALDQELMSTCAFSIDQLMELAGLSVSQAVYRIHPLERGRRILVACGPGNNGGDGLVAARHLFHYGYQPTVYYPKRSQKDLYRVGIVFLGVGKMTSRPQERGASPSVLQKKQKKKNPPARRAHTQSSLWAYFFLPIRTFH